MLVPQVSLMLILTVFWWGRAEKDHGFNGSGTPSRCLDKTLCSVGMDHSNYFKFERWPIDSKKYISYNNKNPDFSRKSKKNSKGSKNKIIGYPLFSRKKSGGKLELRGGVGEWFQETVTQEILQCLFIRFIY